MSSPSYIVGVGASAGGLHHLEELFDSLPPGSGAAFVVVQHLSPDFKSHMKELLARHTAMPVHLVEDDMACEANALYLIPPKKDMTLVAGRLKLTDQDVSDGHTPRFAIDSFFESMAADAGAAAIAVVMSGTGTDGSRGVTAVNEAGGLVLVQDPATAQFDGMPRSAIATGSAHAVLPPREIGASISAYVAQPPSETDGVLFPGAAGRGAILEITEILRSTQGVDFSHYRPSTISRRLSRRITITRKRSVEEYVDFLTSNVSEQEALRDDLLIGVTRFFRDAAAWEHIDKNVIRPLIAERSEAESLRIWCTACSSGEEAYSLGMLVLDAMRDSGKSLDLKIFATDIDRIALQRAALGTYAINVLGEVGKERLARYFTQTFEGFRVNRLLRESIIFAEHNLTRDAPFTRMDLVTCRNVLIYMEPELQENVLRMLHFSLRVNSALMLGSAESLGALESEFEVVHPKWKIFRKRRDVPLAREGRPQVFGVATPLSSPRVPRVPEAPEHNVVERAFRDLMKRGDRTCVIVDRDGGLLHTIGRSEPYLTVPEGRGTNVVTEMVADSLRLPFNAAVQRAAVSGEPASFVRIETPHGDIDLEAFPFRTRGGDTEFLSVVFSPSPNEGGSRTPTFDVDDVARERIIDLESELRSVRENLQATIEELETTNEEHQSTNEELMASNEELQSTNEELQSVNEELFTVNAEYQQKITELTDLNNDMDNLLISTQIGKIVLDGELRIRNLTSNVSQIINVTERDVERRIDHFSQRTDCPDLFDVIANVNADGKLRERVVTNDSEAIFFLRVLPYRREDGSQDGVVLTFMAADELARAVDQIRTRNGDGSSRSQEV